MVRLDTDMEPTECDTCQDSGYLDKYEFCDCFRGSSYRLDHYESMYEAAEYKYQEDFYEDMKLRNANEITLNLFLELPFSDYSTF